MVELVKIKIRKNSKKLNGYDINYRVRIYNPEAGAYEIEIETIAKDGVTIEPMSKEGTKVFKELSSAVRQDVVAFLGELNVSK